MKSPQAIEFKGSHLALTVLKAALRSSDPAAIEPLLADMTAGSPDFFSHEATVFDLAELDATEVPDWKRLVALLRHYRINPVGVCNAGDSQVEAALAAGLVLADLTEAPVRQAPRAPEPPPPAPEPVVVTAPAPATLVVDRPLRSGQQVYARGGDVVVLAMVNAGAEVIADGNIHVYAPLRGRALAGAAGNARARIFTTCFEAELVSIAGIYRTFEAGVEPEFAGQPAQIRLAEDDPDRLRLLLEPLAIR